MPLFVPDKTKFKNLTTKPFPTLGTITASTVFKDSLLLFTSLKKVVKIGRNETKVNDINDPSTQSFTPLNALEISGRVVLTSIRASASPSIYSSIDGENWDAFNANLSPANLCAATSDGEYLYLLYNSPKRIQRTKDFINFDNLYSHLTIESVGRTNARFNFIPKIKKVVQCLVVPSQSLGRLIIIDSENGGVIKKDLPSGISYIALREIKDIIFAVAEINGVKFLCELDNDLNIVKTIGGEMSISPTSTQVDFMGECGNFIYILMSDSAAFILDGSKTRLIGKTENAASSANGIKTGSIFQNIVYVGAGDSVLSTTL